MPRDDKVAILKDSLAAIGRRIDSVLDQKRNAGEDADRWRRHLWTWVLSCYFLVSMRACRFWGLTPRFVTLFWPKQVKAAKLEEIHAKMVMKEGTPRTSSDSRQRPRPSGGSSKPMANGVHASTSASSSSRTNGKSYRWPFLFRESLYTLPCPCGFCPNSDICVDSLLVRTPLRVSSSVICVLLCTCIY